MESVSIYVISQWISVSIDIHIYNTSFANKRRNTVCAIVCRYTDLPLMVKLIY